MWPFPYSREDISLLAGVLDEMSRGNYDGAVPQFSGSLKPLSSSIKRLKATYSATFFELKRQQDELTSIINALPNALIFIAHGRVSVFNSSAQRLFDLKPTDLHKPYAELALPQALREKVNEFLRSGAKSRQVLTESNALMQTFQVALTRINEQDANAQGDLNFIISATDITQRVKTDVMRKDFVAAASHELKTPVAGMSLMCETAQLALKDGDLAAASDMLHHMQKEAQNLQSLVGDLLDLSRFEESAQHQSHTDLIKTAHTTLVTRRARAQAQHIELRDDWEAFGLQELFVPLHEADLIIVLDNLIDNALAYTDSGSVTLRITTADDAAQAIIEVIDTGIGIDEKDFDRIFERFYRIDKSRSRISGGTGLGLSLVKHAVEQAGGSIAVSSRVGAGTTFRVTLPLIR